MVRQALVTRKITLRHCLLLSGLVHAIPWLVSALVFKPMPQVAQVYFSVKLSSSAQPRAMLSGLPQNKTSSQVNPEFKSPVSLTGELAQTKVTYEMLLASRIEKFRFYPQAAQRRGIEGTSVVRLLVNASGALVEATIEHSSGDVMLDEAALEIIARAQPFPPPPKEYLALGDTTLVFHAPIVFQLKSLN